MSRGVLFFIPAIAMLLLACQDLDPPILLDHAFHCPEGSGIDLETLTCEMCAPGERSGEGFIEGFLPGTLVPATLCVPDDTPNTTCSNGQGFDPENMECRDCPEGFESGDGSVNIAGMRLPATVCLPIDRPDTRCEEGSGFDLSTRSCQPCDEGEESSDGTIDLDGVAVPATLCVALPTDCVPDSLEPNLDTDNDGINNLVELDLSALPAFGGTVDPCTADTDGDGALDGFDLSPNADGTRARIRVRSFRQHDALPNPPGWAWMDDLGDGAWNLSGELYFHAASVLGTGDPVGTSLSIQGFTFANHLANVNSWDFDPSSSRGTSNWIAVPDDLTAWTTGASAWGELISPAIVASLLPLDSDGGETIGLGSDTLYFDTRVNLDRDGAGVSLSRLATIDLVFGLWSVGPTPTRYSSPSIPASGQGTVSGVLSGAATDGTLTNLCTTVYDAATVSGTPAPTLTICFDFEVEIAGGRPINACRLAVLQQTWETGSILGIPTPCR